jgi:hypothetical protein
MGPTTIFAIVLYLLYFVIVSYEGTYFIYFIFLALGIHVSAIVGVYFAFRETDQNAARSAGTGRESRRSKKGSVSFFRIPWENFNQFF